MRRAVIALAENSNFLQDIQLQIRAIKSTHIFLSGMV